jgi:hypothetical protein
LQIDETFVEPPGGEHIAKHPNQQVAVKPGLEQGIDLSVFVQDGEKLNLVIDIDRRSGHESPGNKLVVHL